MKEKTQTSRKKLQTGSDNVKYPRYSTLPNENVIETRTKCLLKIIPFPSGLKGHPTTIPVMTAMEGFETMVHADVSASRFLKLATCCL